MNLVDGSRNSGATTATLTINPTLPSDSGSCDVLLTNTCGNAASVPAILAVSCYPDCNGDGLFSVADYGCFQTKFTTGCP